jgi:hypothetical protein
LPLRVGGSETHGHDRRLHRADASIGITGRLLALGFCGSAHEAVT